MKKSNAFTMIELVFVIVVLGILTAIAVPKFAATRDDAKIAAGRATVAAVRSGIVAARQRTLLSGITSYPSSLEANMGLQYPPGSGWSSVSGSGGTYTVAGQSAVFTYRQSDGKFTCASSTLCTKLTK